MRHVVSDHPHEHRGLSFGLSCPRLLSSATVRPVASRAWTKTCGPARTSVCKFGKRVRIKIHGKDNYQLDGDVVGESTTLDAEIQPGALTICVPAQAASEPQQ